MGESSICGYLRLLTDETRCSRRVFVIDNLFLSTINSTVCQPNFGQSSTINWGKRYYRREQLVDSFSLLNGDNESITFSD